MLVVQNEWNKVTVRPTTSMLLFLCESYITQYVHKYTNLTKGPCGPSINNNLKIAANAWRWEHFNWGIFKSLQPKLSGGQIAISDVYHNRLPMLLLKRWQTSILHLSNFKNYLMIISIMRSIIYMGISASSPHP